MNKKIILLLILILAINITAAQQSNLNLNIYLDASGEAALIGKASYDPLIQEINFETGKVYGSTNLLTSKAGERWTFSLSTSDYEGINAEIFLPENAELILDSVATNNNIIITEEKGAIIVKLSGQGKIDIKFDYVLGESQSSLWIWLISAAAIIILVLIFFFYKRAGKEKKIIRKRERKQDKLKIISRTLNERENIILKTLVKEKGRSTQGALQKLTGIPKAAFSRHLMHLEKKGIIKKQGIGRLNRVELVKQ